MLAPQHARNEYGVVAEADEEEEEEEEAMAFVWKNGCCSYDHSGCSFERGHYF